MNPRRMMIVGVILVIAAIALFAFVHFMVGEEGDSIKRAARFDGGAAGAAKQGDLVLVEGRVSVKNRILIHDFVDAVKEHPVKGGSWSTLKEYRQPVLADLARGEIILASDTLCTEAKGNNILETDERSEWDRKIRYIGLRRGDPITAIGTLNSLTPAALTVKYWYSGSVDDYKNSLTSSRRNGYIFCPIIAVVGVGFFLLGWKKR